MSVRAAMGVMPMYKSMSVGVLKNRIKIIKMRGTKENHREIPHIHAELRRRGKKRTVKRLRRALKGR